MQDQMLLNMHPKKQFIKQVNFYKIKDAVAVTKSKEDNVEKQEPAEEIIIIPPQNIDEILNKLRKVL